MRDQQVGEQGKKPLTLRELRERALLSQAELAQSLGKGKQIVTGWENGDFKPHFKSQRLLKEKLQCTSVELFEALQHIPKKPTA